MATFEVSHEKDNMLLYIFMTVLILRYWAHRTSSCEIKQLPDFYFFPPFFTLQPVISTRNHQLRLWRDMIVQYHTFHKQKILVVHDCPLFINKTIDRQLNDEAIQVIMDDLIQR